MRGALPGCGSSPWMGKLLLDGAVATLGGLGGF